MTLEVLPATFAICRLEPDARVPKWALGGSFTSISRSGDELSIVCEDEAVPESVDAQRGWRALRVEGPLDTTLVGVVASLALPLAKARISLISISTYDTDYLLVRGKKLDQARQALLDAGHRFADADVGERPEKRPAPAPKAEPQEREVPKRGTPEHEAPKREPAERPRRERPAWLGPLAPRRAREEEPRDEVEEVGKDARPEKVEKPEPRERVREAEPEERPRRRPEREEKPERGARRSRRDEGPEDDIDSKGLFTGGIAQHQVPTTSKSFADLGVSAPIIATLSRLGFVHPTEVQVGAIPPALEGRDVIGLAETGSGKTAAFSLPMAERLTHGHGIRGLILCPTREIALQTQSFLETLGRDHALTTLTVIGGVRMGPQISGFKADTDILVATPGRLADHIRRRNVRLDKIEHLVLDEADHMLDLGFLPQIKEILEELPEKRQTMMFSATMPPPIESLSRLFMKDPVRVDLRPKGHTAEGIEHRLYLVKDEDDRKRCLFQLLREEAGTTLVFARRKIHTEWLARQLELGGFEVERIHSDRSQGQRVSALKGFREGDHRILVATDVAARGIDVPGIEHVINYGLPDTVEDYVHRGGRTARGAAIGIVSSIATWQEKETVRDIEVAIGQDLPRCRVEGVEPYVELKPRKQVRRRRLL